MRLALLTAAAFLMWGQGASAQHEVSADEGEAAAKALISRAAAGDVFEPGSWEFGPRVRHLRSGMSCRFVDGQPGNAITIYDPKPTRGDDVGCKAVIGEVVASQFASRVSLVGPFDQAAARAIAAFEDRVGGSKAYTGEVFELNVAAMPPSRIHRRVVEVSGRSFYERVAVVDLGDWIITQRITAPLQDAPSVDRMASLGLALTAREVAAWAKGDRPTRPPLG